MPGRSGGVIDLLWKPAGGYSSTMMSGSNVRRIASWISPEARKATPKMNAVLKIDFIDSSYILSNP